MVIKVDEMHMHVMTEGGEFRRLRTPRGSAPCPGEVITLPLFHSAGSLHALAAALVALFVLGTLLFPSPGFVATVHVEMEINPAVRMSLDSEGYVGSVVGLDDDGVRLVSAIEINYMPIEEMMEGILEMAFDLGFLTMEAENLVLIAVSAADGSSGHHVPDAAHLRSVAGAILHARGLPGAVAASHVSHESAERAQEAGLSMAREMIRQHLEEAEEEVILESVRDLPMGELVREAGPPVWAMFRAPPGRSEDTWTPPPGWSRAPHRGDDAPEGQQEETPQGTPAREEPPGRPRGSVPAEPGRGR